MSTLEPDAQHDATEKTPPCAACDRPSIGRIWLNTDVCGACFSDWQNRAPDTGAVAAKYGDTSLDALTKAYENFTDGWLKKRRSEVRQEAA